MRPRRQRQAAAGKAEQSSPSKTCIRKALAPATCPWSAPSPGICLPLRWLGAAPIGTSTVVVMAVVTLTIWRTRCPLRSSTSSCSPAETSGARGSDTPELAIEQYRSPDRRRLNRQATERGDSYQLHVLCERLSGSDGDGNDARLGASRYLHHVGATGQRQRQRRHALDLAVNLDLGAHGLGLDLDRALCAREAPRAAREAPPDESAFGHGQHRADELQGPATRPTRRPTPSRC